MTTKSDHISYTMTLCVSLSVCVCVCICSSRCLSSMVAFLPASFKVSKWFTNMLKMCGAGGQGATSDPVMISPL